MRWFLVLMAAGRSAFRVSDLVALTRLVEQQSDTDGTHL